MKSNDNKKIIKFIYIKKFISYLSDFLANFNMYSNCNSNDLLKNIIIKKDVSIYDEEGKWVGFISLSNGKLFVSAAKENYDFRIRINPDQKNEKACVFEYFLYDKNSSYDGVSGSCIMFEAKNKDDIINNIMDVVYNDKRYRCKFNTIRNRFKISSMYDYNNVSYSNNEFSHSNRDEEISIENDYGNVIYSKTSSNKEKENIYGKTKINYNSKSYDVVTNEFNNILKEIDPNYFKLLNEIKDAVNHFEPSLFEKLAGKSIKSDISVLENMLDINKDSVKKGHIAF